VSELNPLNNLNMYGFMLIAGVVANTYVYIQFACHLVRFHTFFFEEAKISYLK